uniref:Uncharacterized protein n=1 Tax=Triticum urartu TaxID=4572 RepID=A0A8R7UPI4_TRIUA
MQPHHLLHHGLQVRQARRVRLLEGVRVDLAAEDVLHLRARLGHGARVPEQLGHRPLHRDGHRVGPGREHVEQYHRHLVATDLACGNELQQRVQEVAVRVLARARRPGICQAAVDYAVKYAKDLLVARPRPATPALQVQRPEGREDVGDVGLAERGDDVLHDLPQLTRGLSAHVHHVDGEEGAGHEVQHAAVHGLADVHLLPRAAAEVAHHVAHLALAHAARHGEATRREDV